MDNDTLGPVLSEHRGRFAAGGIGWYIGGLLFVASIYGLGKAVFEGDWSKLLYMLLFAAGTGLFLLYNYSRYAQRLVIHRDGFVWNRLLRAPLVVRFDEVVEAKMSAEISRNAMHLKGQHVEIDLRLRDGSFITITNDLDGVEALTGYVQAPPAAAATEPSPWG